MEWKRRMEEKEGTGEILLEKSPVNDKKLGEVPSWN
jgi:hypothetical protein